MLKMKKYLTLLLAGLLICTSLFACDTAWGVTDGSDLEDDREQAGSDSDSGSSKYKNLDPEGIWNALLEADDFTVTMKGTSQEGEDKSIVIYTITKDGDKLKLSMESTYDTETRNESVYYDLKENRAYEEEDGQWYYREDDEDIVELSDLMDDLFPVDLLFDEACYQEYNSDTRDYVLKPDAIAEELSAPEDVVCEGEMTVKGSIYTFTVGAENDERKLEYEFTVKFTTDSIKLPDAKPVENEGEAVPDEDEK